ncbi:tail protein X [Anaerotignum sp.]
MKEYITQAGDQWDMIAKKVYGNELRADILMQNNMELLDIYEFDAGTVIRCPELEKAATEDLPPWRR